MSQETLTVRAIGRVIVPSADQDRSIAFYTGALGFELRADEPYGDGMRWVEVAPPDAFTTIALSPPMEGFGPGGVCIVLDCTDIEADRAELAARGVDIDPEVQRMPGGPPPMCFLRDPDGNQLLLIEVPGA
jgi:catechol 2,3-dioxygenase-like lactoylglutathione lyase family enzyme